MIDSGRLLTTLVDLQNLRTRLAPPVTTTQPATQPESVQRNERSRYSPQSTVSQHPKDSQKPDEIEEEAQRNALNNIGNQIPNQQNPNGKNEQEPPQSRTIQPSVAKKKKIGLEWMLGGAVIRKTPEPPSVEELQKIAEDVRQGLY